MNLENELLESLNCRMYLTKAFNVNKINILSLIYSYDELLFEK
jgi:hypothetical protein